MGLTEAQRLVGQSPAERLASAFGQTAGAIGIVIAMASIVGICLVESGAASRIVTVMLGVCGVRRAPEGLALSSFLLGIPVFFDTVFYLMVPLARSLCRRTGRDYVLYILAIMAGGSIAHSLVPPTPGPLQVAEILDIPILPMMFAGLAIGSVSSLLSLAAARTLNRWTTVPLRPFGEDQGGGQRPATARSGEPAADRQPPVDANQHVEEQGGPAAGPPLLLALLPIVLPILLIALGSTQATFGLPLTGPLVAAIELLGDRNVALAVAAVVALGLLRYAPAGHDVRGAVGRALAGGGQIILITSSGGALGVMLRQAGIAGVVSEMAADVPGVLLLVVVFLVTTAIRTLQGSATVAMITSAGVLQGVTDVANLPFHPVYVAMAIGVGSKPIAWMTDSGFWVMCKMSGMSEIEGLRTVTALSIAMGLSGLLVTVVFAMLVPAV